MGRQFKRWILVFGPLVLRPASISSSVPEAPQIRHASEQLRTIGPTLHIALIRPPEANHSLLGVDDRVVLAGQEQWSAVFGNREQEFHFAVRTREPMRGRVAWTFSVQRHTVSQGEAAFTSDSNKPAQIDVRLAVPAVKNDVIVQGRLSVSVSAGGQSKPEAVQDRAIWIFPSDPFVNRGHWLKGLKITLFDPEARTAAVFQNMNIPFDSTRNVAAVRELTDGVLVIGEGVSFKDYRDLPETMLKVAAAGVPVLCLAPAEGLFPIPGSGNAERPAVKGISLRRQDVIAEFDKRLDAVAWPPDGRVVTSSLLLQPEGEGIVVAVAKGSDGWCWFEMSFPESTAKLALCGFAFIDGWDAGPTPRFLLARLLESLSQSAGENTETKEPLEKKGASNDEN